MSKYAVAYVSYNDNELRMEVIEAESKVAAAVEYLRSSSVWTECPDYVRFAVLQSDLFDGDALINVIKIR
jgi:hypothetical protein